MKTKRPRRSWHDSPVTPSNNRTPIVSIAFVASAIAFYRQSLKGGRERISRHCKINWGPGRISHQTGSFFSSPFKCFHTKPTISGRKKAKVVQRRHLIKIQTTATAISNAIQWLWPFWSNYKKRRKKEGEALRGTPASVGKGCWAPCNNVLDRKTQWSIISLFFSSSLLSRPPACYSLGFLIPALVPHSHSK